jgi:hypothetical protein
MAEVSEASTAVAVIDRYERHQGATHASHGHPREGLPRIDGEQAKPA